MRMRLAWISNTRPDLLYEISQLAQVTQMRYDEHPNKIVRRINKAIRYAHEKPGGITFLILEAKSLRVVGYSDAGYSSNNDLSSQLGRIVLLINDTCAAAPIIFKSYKSRRIARSVLSAEANAFADLYDDAYALRSQVGHALSRTVPMHLLIDSKFLFDVVSKGSKTSEKRTMLDIHAARQAYKLHEMSNIDFVRTSHSLAHGLPKASMQAALYKLITTERHEVEAEQWIKRDPAYKRILRAAARYPLHVTEPYISSTECTNPVIYLT